MRLVYGDTISSTSESFRPLSSEQLLEFADPFLGTLGIEIKAVPSVAIFGDPAQRGIALAAENHRQRGPCGGLGKLPALSKLTNSP